MQNEEVDRQVERDIEAAKIAALAPNFETDKAYLVDGKRGLFVRSYNDKGRPKYVFNVMGEEITIDFDFLHLIS